MSEAPPRKLPTFEIDVKTGRFTGHMPTVPQVRPKPKKYVVRADEPAESKGVGASTTDSVLPATKNQEASEEKGKGAKPDPDVEGGDVGAGTGDDKDHGENEDDDEAGGRS